MRVFLCLIIYSNIYPFNKSCELFLTAWVCYLMQAKFWFLTCPSTTTIAGCPRCHQAHCVLVHSRQSWCHMRQIHWWSKDQCCICGHLKKNTSNSIFDIIKRFTNSFWWVLQMLALPLVSICAHVGWMGWWLEHVHPHHRNNNSSSVDNNTTALCYVCLPLHSSW